jgi:hypothetical protein
MCDWLVANLGPSIRSNSRGSSGPQVSHLPAHAGRDLFQAPRLAGHAWLRLRLPGQRLEIDDAGKDLLPGLPQGVSNGRASTCASPMAGRHVRLLRLPIDGV